ncbi:MAG: hypothetical protein Q8N51_18200 [Gammaproteobacteria bacterium]|nr:hypothetical protein [Gammaproteobacteria bacterium]
MSLLDHSGRRVLGRYLLFMVPASVGWEFAQLPLYTLWETGTRADISLAALHCSVGDWMIAVFSLALAAALAGGREWPHQHYARAAILTVAIGLSYTVFSEWLNIELRQSWAYRDAMPRIPPLGTGLSPVLQWMVLPAFGLWWARRGLLARLRPLAGEAEAGRNP